VRTLTILAGNAFVPYGSAKERHHPVIESFLSRSTVLIHRHTSTAGWICAAHNVKRRPDWPAGAILTHAHEITGADQYWICADPVHLAVERDELIVQPYSNVQLASSESQSLFAALEAHFAVEDLRFVHVDTGRWCIAIPKRPHLVTSDLELVEGRNVNDVLPSGQDSATWQRYVTEAQMILHDHPVNTRREARGETVANSVWLWGGGVVPQVDRKFENMMVSDALLREIGIMSGAQVSTTPSTGINLDATGDCFVEFAAQPADEGDDVLGRLESHLIAPAWQALRSGRLEAMTLVLRLAGAMVELRCDRRGRRRFWNRKRPLSRILATLRDAT
jgi:hypothetical protein